MIKKFYRSIVHARSRGGNKLRKLLERRKMCCHYWIQRQGLLWMTNNQLLLLIFFVSLTKDLPPIKSEWFDLQCPENLPSSANEDVRIELTKLNINKSPGPNDPFMKILKMFANSFAAPLANIYNESLRYKYFPEIWKQYRVAAIPKVGPCTVYENTRPIDL